MRDLSVADQEYFDHIAQDCAQRLGPGIELEDLALDDDDDVVLRLRYRLGAETWTSEGRGETVVPAPTGAARARPDQGRRDGPGAAPIEEKRRRVTTVIHDSIA